MSCWLRAKATWPSSCSTTCLCPKLAQDMPEPIPAFLAMHHFEAPELQESFLGSVVVSHGCSDDMMQPFRLLKYRMRRCFTYVLYFFHISVLFHQWRGKCRSFSYTTCCPFSFPKAPPRITVAQPGGSPEAMAQAQSAPPREDKFDLLEAWPGFKKSHTAKMIKILMNDLLM